MRQTPLENVCRQVPALLPAKWTLRNDPRTWHSLHRRRNILMTLLADDDERIEAGRRSVEHRT